MHSERQRFGFSVLGGPTTVIDIAGRRLVIDPTFDAAGEHGYLTKTVGPALQPATLGPVDAVLISHDQHPDNLDEQGRRFALSAPLVLTHPGAAARLGAPARGLAPWESIELPASGDTTALTIQAVPAVHGPADGQRDETGSVNCEVTGFVLSGAGVPTVYLSGDNASISAVVAIARRVGPVDVAVLFAGRASVPSKERGRPLTLTSERAAAAAEILAARVVIPAHVDGWAHFTEGLDDVVRAFDDAGIGHVLMTAPHGQWILPGLQPE
ncbi:Zn-dependent hydrolase [Mycobacterium intermedium]|uniref:Zn-dependent hydrolase n=1 Tax=Mycobacterium intermedium TaxID=28445 RepID=A0A1E3S5A0_MYCIE|nr:Zn-dependent hydrolase [Mycobacterium intermedium]OPE47428.1 Zn-dependent hydrolase [Mycobacterium intermedium]ORA96457.1 Zn-dependent hydrolase [Mycobacterium intermedium]